MKTITLHPIGVIHTPYRDIKDMPIQPPAAAGVEGRIELFAEYTAGLSGLDGFSHITLVYHFHRVTGYDLSAKPFMDTREHGIFAIRSPRRPNAIGISTVRLISIEGNVLRVEEVDMLDGTPLIDIKPFFARFDNRSNTRSGWLDEVGEMRPERLRSDERFR